MNLAFIGSPASGKTTTAAMLFAQLKENQYPVEWVPEYARLYIAQKKKRPGNFFLSDPDQRIIQNTQLRWETSLFTSWNDKKRIVISDSWSINALLYMKEIDVTSRLSANHAASIVHYVFYCPPLKDKIPGRDPNRVHNRKLSFQIDKKVRPLMEDLGIIEYYPLEGKPFARVSQIINIIGLK